MSWAGDRLSGWFAFLPAAARKAQTKSPSNISSDSGAQLWPLSLNSPHSSALKGPVSSSWTAYIGYKSRTEKYEFKKCSFDQACA